MYRWYLVLGDRGGWDSCFPVEGPSILSVHGRPLPERSIRRQHKSCAVWICPSALRVHQIAIGQVSISGTLGPNLWVDCPTYPLIYPILDQFHPFYMICPGTRTSRTSRRLPGACTGWDLGGEKAWRRMALWAIAWKTMPHSKESTWYRGHVMHVTCDMLGIQLFNLIGFGDLHPILWIQNGDPVDQSSIWLLHCHASVPRLWLPSGKRLHNYEQSPFFMGKPAINCHFQ